MKREGANTVKKSTSLKILIFLVIGYVFWIYYYSNPAPQHYYDYTFRVADNLLRGALGFHEKPPSWLNEFVPFGENWYSVFPLGSVLSMMPFAFFKLLGLIDEMPASLIAALTAAACAFFLIKISEEYDLGWGKRFLLVSAILFGTWMWTNLALASAWQLALGFAVLGELGAIYFTVFKRRPMLAGFFFALAFGNRTEILLTTPVFLYLFLRSRVAPGERPPETPARMSGSIQKSFDENRKLRLQLATLIKFCAVPFVLGVLTLVYNYWRFFSPFDFGYARIPGVLNEPWYAYGIFSIHYIPLNFYEMMIAPWRSFKVFPYLAPSGFGSAIWWSSPFILLIGRCGARDRFLKYAAWAAIAVLTFLLWTHGNPGGWQFGYRYAMILLPWTYIILLENGPRRFRWYEWPLFVFSFAANLFASYLFFWTDYIKSG